MSGATRAEAMAAVQEERFEDRFDKHFEDKLNDFISGRGDTKGYHFAIGFRDIGTTRGLELESTISK